MIIGLSGRIKSGKGVISNILVSMGFTKVTIASFLKSSISQLYNIDISYCYDQELKLKELNLPWNCDVAHRLSTIVGVDSLWRSGDKERVFLNVREALQYIGSDVLRRHDPDFHVKKTFEFNDDKNYVCDDVRFVNEKEFIEKYGGKCIFIIRPPEFDSLSNHISETTLNWKLFNHVIINDRDVSYLERSVKKFVDYLTIIEKKKNRVLIDIKQLSSELNLYGTATKLAAALECSRDKVIWWCRNLLIPVIDCKYQYDHSAFLKIDEETAYFAGVMSADGCIKSSGKSSNRFVVDLTNDDLDIILRFKKFVKTNKPVYSRKRNNGKTSYSLIINSPFIVENIKLWNLKPRKSKHNEVPEILLRDENKHLVGYWFVGLIDGDGSISKRGHIRCLASKEITDWLSAVYSDFNPRVYSEKGIENLFSISFHGKYATAISKVLPIHFGQQRKWSRIKASSMR
jgi:hypothetical protein